MTYDCSVCHFLSPAPRFLLPPELFFSAAGFSVDSLPPFEPFFPPFVFSSGGAVSFSGLSDISIRFPYNIQLKMAVQFYLHRRLQMVTNVKLWKKTSTQLQHHFEDFPPTLTLSFGQRRNYFLIQVSSSS